MDKQIKQQWIDALRSGRYNQGQGRLHDPDEGSFCCLGVLCDLYIKSNPDVVWDHSKIGSEEDEEPKDGVINSCEGYLPSEVIDWAGLDDSVSGDVRVIQDDGVVVPVTELNDIGASFQRIARYIETTVDGD